MRVPLNSPPALPPALGAAIRCACSAASVGRPEHDPFFPLSARAAVATPSSSPTPRSPNTNCYISYLLLDPRPRTLARGDETFRSVWGPTHKSITNGGPS